MKEAIYTLSTPVNGVEDLVLHAPSRKNLKFAAAVKGAFMAGAARMADRMSTEDSGGESSGELDGKEMLAALYVMDCDVGDLLERFLCACTNSDMCQAHGAPVGKDFWECMDLAETEGLFAEFLGNFITI